MRKSDKNTKMSFILLTSALVIVFTLLVVVLTLFLTGLTRHKVDKGAVVVTIDGTKIYENQFMFFASLLLEQEDAAYHYTENTTATQVSETLMNETLNFAKEYIYRLREAKKAGITLTKDDLNDLKKTFENEYEDRKKVGTRILKGDAFYDYYYGLTKKQYTQFWKDWAIIEKYNTHCGETADISLSNQERAYEEYKDYLKGCNATVLSISLQGLDSETMTTKRQLANELADSIRAGNDMAELIKKHCDDETLVENSGAVNITKAVGAVYTELYDWTLEAKVGDLAVIETKDALYIIRAESFTDFNTLKDTDTMKEWTRFFAVNEQTATLLNSKKYQVDINTEVYAEIDLSVMIESAMKQWN